MPRISDEFLDAVIYLYPDEEKARAAVAAGGSGFLLDVEPTLFDRWSLSAV